MVAQYFQYKLKEIVEYPFRRSGNKNIVEHNSIAEKKKEKHKLTRFYFFTTFTV